MIIYNKASVPEHRVGETTIELVDKAIVKKTLSGPMHCRKHKDEWMESYKTLSDNNSVYVKVYDILDDRSYTMEYIPNCVSVSELLMKKTQGYRPSEFNLEDTHVGKLTYQERFELIPEIWNTYSIVWSDSFKYNTHRHPGSVFANNDLSIRQFVFDTDMNIRLLDVDEYKYIETRKYPKETDVKKHWDEFNTTLNNFLSHHHNHL